MLLLSSDTAYKAQKGCSVVLHVVESTDRTMMSETLKIVTIYLNPGRGLENAQKPILLIKSAYTMQLQRLEV